MLGKAVLRHSDNRCGIDCVIFRFVELQCKPSAEQARLLCTRLAPKSEIAKGRFPVGLHQHTRLRGRRGPWRHAHRQHCRCISLSCQCLTILPGGYPRPNTFAARCQGYRSPLTWDYHWRRMRMSGEKGILAHKTFIISSSNCSSVKLEI